MEYFPEDVLRDYGDEPTNLMLDLWHQECLEYIKNDIEVIMADRRHNPQLRDIPGTINSASPYVFDTQRWISDALYITDHLTNCSENYRLRLNNVLKKRLPNTNRFVRIIMDILNASDLHSPEQNLKFCYKLTKELKLGKWTEFDQLSDVAAHLKK